jgi:hypothetical protein
MSKNKVGYTDMLMVRQALSGCLSKIVFHSSNDIDSFKTPFTELSPDMKRQYELLAIELRGIFTELESIPADVTCAACGETGSHYFQCPNR